MRQTVGILGTPIDILNTADVLARLEQFIQQGRFHQVATANTDFLINALHDPELHHILRNVDLVVPDGMPVVWAAALMGSHLPERVTGADIVPALARLAAAKGYRVFMLGAAPEVAARAQAQMEKDYPGLQIVGRLSPKVTPLVEMDSDAILDEIEAAKPDILLVAFGNPKQEKWISLHRERLANVPICIGVGGTFDFIAGKTTRAPGWMQKNGLEWIYRLLQEPRRLWKRYVRDLTHFTSNLLRQWAALRWGYRTGRSEMFLAKIGGYTVLSVVGDLTAPIVPRLQAAAEEALNAKTHLVLDFQSVRTFDVEALGTLINLPKRAAYRGCEVRIVCMPRKMAEALRRSQMHGGLYDIVGTVAEAFATEYPAGLSWHTLRGALSAVITVCGMAERNSACLLEKVCRELLESGKRVDMDARGITYADTCLLSVLHRLNAEFGATAEGGPHFRLAPGDILQETLLREKIFGKFTIIPVPEPPAERADAQDDSDTGPLAVVPL